MISCRANEIEMKGFNAKMRKESQKEIAKQGLVMDESIRPKIGLRMGISRFGKGRELGVWVLEKSHCCMTRENSNFLKNGKIIISVKIQIFSRS